MEQKRKFVGGWIATWKASNTSTGENKIVKASTPEDAIKQFLCEQEVESIEHVKENDYKVKTKQSAELIPVRLEAVRNDD